jgi:hypothetical protein
MHISYKISSGYYLKKNGEIVPVIIFWHGETRTGKHLAKVCLWGRSEEEAFWVDASRVSFEREPLERLQKEQA